MAALLKSALMVEGIGSEHEDATVARRAAGDLPSSALAPDPEVAATAKRRRFSGAEKRRILTEAELAQAVRIRCGETPMLVSRWRNSPAHFHTSLNISTCRRCR